MAARTWTAAQRQRQREAIQRWKPWSQSTGPRSAEGKAAAARNAYSGNPRDAMRRAIKELREALRAQRDSLEEVLSKGA